MTARVRIRGIGRFRAMLRALPASTHAELVALLAVGSEDVRDFARALSPYKTGALMRGIKAEVFPKTLKSKVGIWRKADRSRLFYGHILNAGRLGVTIPVTRRAHGKQQSYMMKVRAMAPQNFMPDTVEVQSRLQPALNVIWARILSDASQKANGAGDGV